jgi:hypothetical protein
MIVATFTRILESGCLRSQTGPRESSLSERFQRLETQVGEMGEELKKVSRHLRLKDGR